MQYGQITELSNVIAYETLANDGYTIALDGKIPTSGYMVSCHKDKERVLEVADVKTNLSLFISTIQWMMMEYKDILQYEGMYLGTWISEGKIYIDISTNVQSIYKANSLARDNDQIAFWSLGDSIEIETISEDWIYKVERHAYSPEQNKVHMVTGVRLSAPQCTTINDAIDVIVTQSVKLLRSTGEPLKLRSK